MQYIPVCLLASNTQERESEEKRREMEYEEMERWGILFALSVRLQEISLLNFNKG